MQIAYSIDQYGYHSYWTSFSHQTRRQYYISNCIWDDRVCPWKYIKIKALESLPLCSRMHFIHFFSRYCLLTDTKNCQWPNVNEEKKWKLRWQICATLAFSRGRILAPARIRPRENARFASESRLFAHVKRRDFTWNQHKYVTTWEGQILPVWCISAT